MVTIRLDLAGRLRSLLAVPSGPARDAAPAALFDELLDAAGFDPATDCTRTEATLTPPVAYTGEPAAWTCVYPEAPEIEMQVAAAAFGATPIYFEIRGPWWQASRPAASLAGGGWFLLTMLGGAALLAAIQPPAWSRRLPGRHAPRYLRIRRRQCRCLPVGAQSLRCHS
jgi:hypothetical protein